jgi:hypothetical protein
VTGREAARFRRIVERAVRPGDDLPPVHQTDAVAAFDAWLRAAPRANRLLVRGLLRLGPERSGPLGELLERLALHCYYGDERVMRRLGYDPDRVVASGRGVRAAEGRP